MKYRYFEALVLAVGAVVILGAVAMSALGGVGTNWMMIVGELLILPVLAAAVHWGRNGGFLAAAGALVFYVVFSVLLVTRHSGVEPPMIELVIFLAVAYGAVGVIGGELCTRVKDTLTRMDGGGGLDSDTRLYSESVSRRLVESGLARYRRYGTSFSLVVLTMPSGAFAGMKPMQRRMLLQRTTSRVRRHLRLVDDVGRLGDGRIIVMLPHTDDAGVRVVAKRVAALVAASLETEPVNVGVQVMACETDESAVEDFIASLQGAEADNVIELATNTAARAER